MKLLLATSNKGKVTEMREAHNGLSSEPVALNDIRTLWVLEVYTERIAAQGPIDSLFRH